jgi:hypothetical protein
LYRCFFGNSVNLIHCYYESVTILVRIRIRGPVPLTYGSGSCLVRQWLTRSQQKICFFFQSDFAYYVLFDGTFTSVFKGKTSIRSKNNAVVETKYFLTVLFLLVDGRIRIRTNNDGSGSGRPKNIRIRSHNTETCNNYFLFEQCGTVPHLIAVLCFRIKSISNKVGARSGYDF